MRWRPVLESLGMVLLIFSLTFLIPIGAGLVYGEGISRLTIVFLLPMAIVANIGIGLWLLGRERYKRKNLLVLPLAWALFLFLLVSVSWELFYLVLVVNSGIIITLVLLLLFHFERSKEVLRDRDAFFMVAVGWLVFAFFGSLPYTLSGALGKIDAYFESMSGFCTCGSTTAVGLDYWPESLLLWRSFTQWLGGLGIIMLSVIVLARVLGVGAPKLLGAEMPGLRVTRLKPRIRHTALILWGIYVFFTTIQILLLTVAGMGLFDAVNHSFTCIATGGFSTKDANVGYFNNPWVEGIMAVFMLLGATSFVLHYRLAQGKITALLKDSEFKFYMLTIILSIIIITLIMGPLSFRWSAFQVISIHTASGFTTTNFAIWPYSAQLLLFLLMFIGGCIGSTAGGIKAVRILILLKMASRRIRKTIRPRIVIPLRLGKTAIPEKVASHVTVFFFLYLALFIIASIILSAIAEGVEGWSLASSVSAVATTMGTVGPGLGAVHANFASVPPMGKILLAICMWLGRLEIFTCLVIFFPETYK